MPRPTRREKGGGETLSEKGGKGKKGENFPTASGLFIGEINVQMFFLYSEISAKKKKKKKVAKEKEKREKGRFP